MNKRESHRDVKNFIMNLNRKKKKTITSVIIKRDICIIHYTFHNYLLTFFIHLFIYTISHLPKKKKDQSSKNTNPSLPYNAL